MPRESDSLRLGAASPAVAGFRLLGLALALAGCFGAGQALAQPSGRTDVHGTATATTAGGNTTITTVNGPNGHSAFNWNSFNVPGGTTTNFVQPSAASLSINRVTGNDPSAIYGTLMSNGRLVLVNPYGITVGAGAVVDTAGFTASTLRMSDADAIAGRLRFEREGNPGQLTVNGSIVARGGDIVLVSRNIEVGRSAVVEAQGDGSVVLAAGRKVEITGRGLEGISFEVEAGNAQARNLGQLRGNAVGIFADQLTHSGHIIARTAANRGGKVVLLGDDITIAPDDGAPGIIEASGASGGGTILIGGEAAGAQALPGFGKARRVSVASGAQIRADALSQGDGGRVVLWADQQLDVQGSLSARGGYEGGNGGTVVTASRRLDFGGSVDVSAPASTGTAGTWRVGARTIDVERDDDDVDLYDAEDEGGGRSAISADAVQGVLNQGGRVVLATGAEAIGDQVGGDGRIRIRDQITKDGSRAATLEMRARTDVLVEAAVRSSSYGGPLNLHFNAASDRSIRVLADIDLRGGAMTADSGGPAIVFGDYGSDALSIRARLLGHRFELRHDLHDSNLTLGTGAILDWFGGTTIAGSSLLVESGAVMNIKPEGASPDPENHVLRGSDVTNFGFTFFEEGAGPLLLEEGSQFHNARSVPSEDGIGSFAMGTFTFLGQGTIGGGSGSFVNDGILIKAGEGTATLDTRNVQFQFRPQSNVIVQQGMLLLDGAREPEGFAAAALPTFTNEGFLTVLGGATFAAPDYTLVNQGNILGSGTIVAQTLRNEGFIAPLEQDGNNVLTVQGNFEQTETGQLFLTVRSPTQHDSLHIAGGTATLGGEILMMALDDAAYAQGSTFDVITGASAVSGNATMAPEEEFSGTTTSSGFRATAQRSRVGPAPAPSDGGTPPPSSSPSAPAGPPPSNTQAGRIVDLLGGQVTLAQAQGSIQDLQGTVTTGLDAPEDRQDRPPSNDAICLR